MDARLLDVLQLARDGRRDTALLSLRSYVRIHPEDPDAWIVLGELAPDRKIALSALRRAVQLAPQSVTAREALAALEAKDAEPKPLTEPGQTRQSEEKPALEKERAEEAPETEPAWDAGFQAMRDARAVVWPFAARGQKNRTLGALLDENRLTRQDLRWAVQEARNENVRWASKVLLETTHRLADVTMTPEDARLIAWPFRRLNRPLGDLVDAGTVKAKDLRRAAWYAKDARLREAARLMLPIALERYDVEQRKRADQKKPKLGTVAAQPDYKAEKTQMPEADAGASHKAGRLGRVSDDRLARPMPVIQGSEYLTRAVQRRYRKNRFIAATAFTLVFVGLLVVLASIVVDLIGGKTPALWLWPLVAVLVLPLFSLSDRFVELWRAEQSFRRGLLGETEVARQLRLGLGGEWTLFRNVKLPSSKVSDRFDIDMVLLGPPGVFALEVKAYTGDYRYVKQHFYRRAMMGWRRMRHNPGKQARATAGVLHAYITETLNEDVWVEPRLVWVGPGDLTLQEPEVFVWFVAKLDQETERLRALPRKLSAEKRAALSGLLRGLCSTLR